ncbi:MFS transporter [Acrocarpospora catenulata]|uniref:MFS transporter n=1 Tax=Acrocarpospora catenulata TaxID=2836182 RepID=UPI001BDA44B5|nr:MFS transporter [Acrocarpospora catenulata]
MTSATSATTPFRVVRAVVFATVSVVLSVGAHAYAGGSVSAGSLLLALALSLVVGLALAGRERSMRAIFPALAGCQAVLHLLFSYAHTIEPVAGHHHATTLLPSLSMLIAHAWAAGLTALWLARGEALLWGLLRRLEFRLLLLLRVVLDPGHAQPSVPPAECVIVPRSALFGHEMGRRGPPGIVSLVAA